MTAKRANPGRRRRPFSRRFSPRRAERYIAAYELPAHLEGTVRRRYPQVSEDQWPIVEQGLREWLVCCAWRRRWQIAMPSQVVDEAWHAFILDSAAYIAFCDAAYGDYLHHSPADEFDAPRGEGMGATIEAWDSSGMAAEGESVLWELDERLAIPEPLGLTTNQLEGARASRGPQLGSQTAPLGGASDSVADGGGSGCGGGGCGGGG